jgi:hypothetical protein
MVSSAVGLSLEELLEALARISREHGDDPEYQRLRAELPEDWPL